ncbi:methyl-accepting chemotaxis protein [Propionivibrio dicarboxylicus]|uniref:Methyl-accepting chemotaxis sensory transducer with Cache sensor n=1 Tax=Propionivibrio dicarboxylicus TaxID=83767 RepID=A0A1G7VMJ1_9RHOO|nr:methyl-accepting chemotaxis protein [Propionivibrio dicarboxylicus]SDG60791.1 methyl-accepting chemotaxis sensory transducer with Cache sensor [Propionivibrio dicarboxylicus]
MKLSTRLGLVVGLAALGTVILVLVALQVLRMTMLEDRRAQIMQTLNLAGKQVDYFVAMEKKGTLSREEAQARAKEAALALRDGNDYVFIRDFVGTLLVHPDPKRVGKVDVGAKVPDGRTTLQVYLDGLKNADPALVEIMTAKAGTTEPVPKLNGVTKIPSWEWMIGYGLFIDDIDAAYRKNAIYLGLIGFAVFVVVVVSALLMAKRIYGALGGEPEYAAEMARAIAAGDLSQRIEYSRSAGSLMESIELMQKSLHDIILAIKQNADRVGNASDSLTLQMGQINAASLQSLDAITATAIAIEEIAVSVNHISQSAKETETNAVNANQLALDGESLVNSASQEFQRAAKQVEDASGMIGSLVERSYEIGGIARVIKEIADQTNLLALNAAIEAARAGEQGRGFAVVADEVRKLAERTSLATDQITGMIEGIHKDTANVVDGMRAVGPQVLLGVEIVGKTGSALRKISDATQVAKGNVSEVAAATSEQSQASATVARNVEQISSMIEASAKSVEQANSNVRMLEQLANELRNSAARFQV